MRTAEEIAEMIIVNMGLDCYRCPFETKLMLYNFS